MLVAGAVALTALAAASPASASEPASPTAALTASAHASATPVAGRRIDARPASRRRAYYGAISVSPDWAAGYAYDYRTRGAALRASLQRCKRRNYPGACRKIVWVRNGCAAVAAKWDPSTHLITRWSWGVAFKKRTAIHRAKRKLPAPKRTVAWVCTTRFR